MKRTRVDVFPVTETKSIANDTFTRHEVIPTSLDLLTLPPSPSHRPNSVGVTESNDSESSDHSGARVGARSGLHDFPNGTENVVGVDTEFAGLLEGIREEVEEEFRVRGSVDVSVSVVIHVVMEVRSIGEVSVL